MLAVDTNLVVRLLTTKRESVRERRIKKKKESERNIRDPYDREKNDNRDCKSEGEVFFSTEDSSHMDAVYRPLCLRTLSL